MCGPSVPIGRVPAHPSLQTGASACMRASVHVRVAPEESNCLYGNLITFIIGVADAGSGHAWLISHSERA